VIIVTAAKTYTWMTTDCFNLKNVLPVCEYPFNNFTEKFPASKGNNFFLQITHTTGSNFLSKHTSIKG
jgi:hypothetical protein